jgi:hypothetical protein
VPSGERYVPFSARILSLENGELSPVGLHELSGATDILFPVIERIKNRKAEKVLTDISVPRIYLGLKKIEQGR